MVKYVRGHSREAGVTDKKVPTFTVRLIHLQRVVRDRRPLQPVTEGRGDTKIKYLRQIDVASAARRKVVRVADGLIP